MVTYLISLLSQVANINSKINEGVSFSKWKIFLFFLLLHSSSLSLNSANI